MSKAITITALGTRELWDAFRANPMQVYRDTAAQMEAAGIEDAPPSAACWKHSAPAKRATNWMRLAA
jgi:hypothetical protein